MMAIGSRLEPGSLRALLSVLMLCQYSPRMVGSSFTCVIIPLMPGRDTRTFTPTANRFLSAIVVSNAYLGIESIYMIQFPILIANLRVMH